MITIQHIFNYILQLAENDSLSNVMSLDGIKSVNYFNYSIKQISRQSLNRTI